MQSSKQNTTGSSINQVALKDEIKMNIVVNGVIKEAGKTQYYISGIQKDKIRVPRIYEVPLVPQPVRNVPPCLCAIRQMTDKDTSLSVSKEDISWTKEEGLCPGKKYRPNEPGAYSCKTYPGDIFCRHNPFVKEIIKMEKKKIENRGEGEEEVKEKTGIIENKFISNPDYPAYDDETYPWNTSRIAPTAKTDHETTLNLTLPTNFSPLKIQENQNNISSSKELKNIKNNVLNKANNNKNYKNSLKSSKKIQNEINEKKNIKKKNKEPISLKNIAINKKNIKLSNTISKSMTTFKTEEKQQTKSLNNPTKQSNTINKLTNHSSVKEKKNVNAEKIDNRKRETKKLKNTFKSVAEILDDIQPAILLRELPTNPHNPHNPKEKIDEIIDSSAAEEESCKIEKGPYGRTKSEQELPAKKTLVYLCEPDSPLEMMAVRSGGRPCKCRENRNKKKILLYNISGLVEKKRDWRGVTRMRLEEENRIIDGIFYVTPPISPRRSDEYIPEYNLLESPYDMCVSEATDKTLKLIEKYSGPKSLVEKIQKKPRSCSCNKVTKEDLTKEKRNLEEARKKLMESKSPEERWKIALKDAALMDYFTQRDNNAPCWTSCKRIARNAR